MLAAIYEQIYLHGQYSLNLLTKPQIIAMDKTDQLEIEKFNFEKAKAERDFQLRERELQLQEKSHSISGFRKLFSNPLLLAAITAVLGLTVDMIIKNYEHKQTLAETRRKQQSDLLMKALDGQDETVIAMKLALLDSLKLVELSHEQRQWVIEAYARSAGVLPEAVLVTDITPDDPGASAKDTAVMPRTQEKPATIKPTKPAQGNTGKPKPVPNTATAAGYCILVGTDVLQREAVDEMKLAQAKYPDARQYVNGKYTLTVVGNFDTQEAAARELDNVRKSLRRPNAYIIRNLKPPPQDGSPKSQ